MALLTAQRLRIQSALVDVAQGGQFPVVRYNPGGSPNPLTDGDLDVPLAPILSNETFVSFENDDRDGRKLSSRRRQWTFSLVLRFNREVVLDNFLNGLARNPPTIVKDTILNFPAVVLRIQQVQIAHPAQQGAATGTLAEIVFEAEEARV